MNAASYRVAIVGCGLIGKRRASTMRDARVVACADRDLEKASALAASVGDCQAFLDWREMLERVDCDISAPLSACASVSITATIVPSVKPVSS
jgi:predicted dehydrogenase